jgi:hypothetical protein
MPDERKPNRLRGIFRNALVWGAGWGAAGTVVSALMRLGDGIRPLMALLDGIGMGIRIGIAGGVAGAAFAAFISVAYRDKRLSEINWVRFGIGGAVFAALFLPTVMETASLLSGDGWVPFNLINGDMLMAAAFGGITAAGTMKLAQLDEVKHPVTVEQLLDQMEQQSLGAGSPVGNQGQRSRSPQSERI